MKSISSNIVQDNTRVVGKLWADHLVQFQSEYAKRTRTTSPLPPQATVIITIIDGCLLKPYRNHWLNVKSWLKARFPPECKHLRAPSSLLCGHKA